MEIQIELSEKGINAVAQRVMELIHPIIEPDHNISRPKAMQLLGCSNNTITTYINDGKLELKGTPRRQEFSYKEVMNLKKAKGK